jgi:beta-glucosidase
MPTKLETAFGTETEARINALVDAMTLEEQVSLLAGADFWTTVPIERLDIPAIKVTDGPNGARGGGSLVGGVKAASFPVSIALASTWNTELVEQIGQALADEARSKSARVLLGPTVNIHRSTLNGRNFECYSEDPFLSSQVCRAYITGLQRAGVAATIKHFVGNESEFERMTISSEIDERALREVYLPPFEVAVKDAQVWAVMAAYNKLDGTFASEHPRLLTGILRREWGFDGVVMSDWFATHSTVEGAEAGLDLEMPGPTRHRGDQLVQAVHSGQVSADSVRESARRVLRLIARVGAFDDPSMVEEQAIDRPEHRTLIRRAGAESIVLLKNESILPLDKNSLNVVAVIGPNARTAQIMGGGSAQLNAHYRVSPEQGIAGHVGPTVRVEHAAGCTNNKLLPVLRGKFNVEYFNTPDLSGPVVFREERADGEAMWFNEVAPGVDRAPFSVRLSGRYTPETSGEHQFGLTSVGLSRLFLNGTLLVDNWDAWAPGDTYFGRGSKEATGTINLEANRTYAVTVEYAYQTDGPLGMKALRIGAMRPLGDEALEEAVRLAAAADVAVLCVGLNGEWDTEGQDRPHMDLVGRQNELITRVAAANPRTIVVLQTGGPVTMPWLSHVPAVLQAWYPGQECGNAIADVLFGQVNPAGRLPQTLPVRVEDNPAFINYPGENGRVRYGEGIFVGYRYYDKKQIEPLFPFGHGLSYTSFEYADLRLSTDSIAPGGDLTVSIDVRNTGARAGQEVVQLYVRDPQARLMRPPKELKGFRKVSLQPGETRRVSLTLDMRALAYFDDAAAAWVAEGGTFEVLVGSSSRDIRARAMFTLTGDWVQPVDTAEQPLVEP